MSDHPDRLVIEAAIAAQERLRGTLDDQIVDASISALRAQLDTPAPESAIARERRLVTVLFMDVVDSTRILQGLDPEEMMTIMDDALQVLAEPVRACGGRVTRFMGDGFLAVFGLHRTRENDAEMAVRAGLGIVESARTIADDVASRHGVAGFRVRVGVNTGLVITGGVTEAEDTIMGSAINLASRIETAAPPDGVLVSQSTYRQVRGRFELEPAGTIDAKGFPEPVPVHLVTGERSDRGAARGVEDVSVEMVGRDEELSTLFQALDDVVATGSAHTVTLSGDAGIGKSRLVAEFEARLPTAPPVAVFRARAGLENADVPHSLLRDLVERCFGIRGDDSVAVVHDKLAIGLGAQIAAGPAPAEKVDVVGRFLGYVTDDAANGTPRSPQQLRDQAVLHLIEFFRAAAEDNPLLMLLDDLQWADDGSLTVLREIVDELVNRPVLTIALARPDVRQGEAGWDHFPNHHLVRLSPLPAEASANLLDSILSKITDCPPELRTRLLEHAGGNPYYLEELVMMCIDDGVIVVDGPSWTVHMDRLAALRVPTTLTGVIRARLDGLEGDEHTLLQQASVVGRVFWDAAVAHIAEVPGTAAIGADLESLEARQMIRHRPTSAFSHAAEYSFSHTLLRDTTYDEVLLSTRRRYHAIVADWLIAASGDREHEFVGLIAGHLEKAGRSAEALEYLGRAAEAAWNSYAVATAADFYDRALDLVPEADLERRYELLLGREKASALEGDRDGQRLFVDELERVADKLGDPAKQTQVGVERTFLEFYTSEFAAALDSARCAATFAATTDDSALQSRVESTLAWAFLYLEDWETARSHGQKALDLALRTDRGSSEATSQNLLGMISLTAGELSEARTRLSRALEIAREEDDRDAANTYLNNLGVVLVALGDYSGAKGHFSEMLDRAVAGGDRRSESTSLVNLAWVAASAGDWETAKDFAARGIAMKSRQGHLEAEAEGLMWLGHALVGLGDLDGATTAYLRAGDLRSDLGQSALELGAVAGLVRVALARGDTDAAMAHAERIIDHLDEGGSLEGTWEPLRIHLTAVEALQASSDERAAQALDRANRLLSEGAAKIADPADRRCYLEAIPWHRRIRELVGPFQG